ncbi:MAG: IPT/TIG domain-containing protein [Phycisphaerales bacterium]|nr:IPT/TIG domain-containing protein [Phycisphaerales bacterium]
MKRSRFARVTGLTAFGLCLCLCMAGCPQTMLDGESGTAPRIDSVAPASGSMAGGESVTIRGLRFDGQAAVLFGEKLATSVRFVNEGVLEAVTPEAAAGMVDVTVVSAIGEQDTRAQAFEFVDDSARVPRLGLFGVAPASGPTDGGEVVTLAGDGFKKGLVVLFDGVLADDTQYVSSTLATAVSPPHGSGKVIVAVRNADGEEATLSDGFEYFAPVVAPDPPEPLRVVGAVALDNKTVKVTFNEPVGEGAEDPQNYEIRGSQNSTLVVTGADAQSDERTVLLDTLSQSADLYTVRVVGVKDSIGRPMVAADGIFSPPEGVDPARAQFAGIPPGSSADQIDSDGDGAADWFEMAGWTVTVELVGGSTNVYHVTSDPFNPDTDGDGVTDAQENAASLDPRSSDTDVDGLFDLEERVEWRSSPSDQDTDDDGLSDAMEVTEFKTSPILADTDGDQFDDRDELFQQNRNPRLADMPTVQIRIGQVRLEVDETFSFTDEMGQTRTRSQSSSTSFAQSRSQSLGTSDSRTNKSAFEFGQKIGTEVDTGANFVLKGVKITGEVSFGQSFAREYTSTVTSETAEESQNAYESSIEESLEFSERRAVTRNVDGGRISVDVSVVGAGDIAYRLKRLELSALQQDDLDRTLFLPVASLTSQSGPDLELNLGPFVPERGPFIFNNTAEVFPDLIQKLMARPRGLIFRVANFDIEDEFGRNFAFTSQSINDRTAGVTIDYGNGTTESYRVATSSRFAANGRTEGISLGTALTEILDLTHKSNETQYFTNPSTVPGVHDSFGTVTNADGVEVLTRVRERQSDIRYLTDSSLDPNDPNDVDPRFWTVIADRQLPDDLNFTDIRLKPGEQYIIAFVQDVDRDGLYAREEYYWGSSDNNPDTDGDGLSDFEEIREGWEVRIPGAAYNTRPDPTRADSDGDGIADFDERELGLDPRKRDTDEDGLKDFEELDGYTLDLVTGVELAVSKYNANNGRVIMITAGPDGIVDTLATGDDEQLDPPGTNVGANAIAVLPGDNGLVETTPMGDDEVRREVRHDLATATDPLNRDTDGDGIFDGREALLGSNPNNPLDAGTVRDTDQDGLIDFTETTRGWRVSGVDAAGNPFSYRVTSDPMEPDSDEDGLPDLFEFDLGSDPLLTDTDGDGLSDLDEPTSDRLREIVPDCAAAPGCAQNVDPNAGAHYGTDLLLGDTDGDTRGDGDEIMTPWVVSVFPGNSPYQVFSDPTVADADLDGWNDAEELNAGTDPGLADTDGDGTADRAETLIDGPRRDPLRKDKQITFKYTTINIIADCDPGGSGGEFEGALRLRRPDGLELNLFTITDRCDDVPEGGDCSVNKSRAFVMHEGENFVAFSSNIEEDDLTDDEQLGSFEESYDFNVGSMNDSARLSDGTGCEIRINWSITVR